MIKDAITLLLPLDSPPLASQNDMDVSYRSPLNNIAVQVKWLFSLLSADPLATSNQSMPPDRLHNQKMVYSHRVQSYSKLANSLLFCILADVISQR